jgi:hypothetical protein
MFVLDSCKWKPTFGCSFKSQLPSSSYEYTNYCTLICLSGKFPNLKVLNKWQDFNTNYIFICLIIQNVVPVLCTNLEGDLLKVRWQISSFVFSLNSYSLLQVLHIWIFLEFIISSLFFMQECNNTRNWYTSCFVSHLEWCYSRNCWWQSNGIRSITTIEIFKWNNWRKFE